MVMTRFISPIQISKQCGLHPPWNETCSCSHILLNITCGWPEERTKIIMTYRTMFQYFLPLFVKRISSWFTMRFRKIHLRSWWNKFNIYVYLSISAPTRKIIDIRYGSNLQSLQRFSAFLYNGPDERCGMIPNRLSGTNKVFLITSSKGSGYILMQLSFIHLLAPQILQNGRSVYNNTVAATYHIITLTKGYRQERHIFISILEMDGMISRECEFGGMVIQRAKSTLKLAFEHDMLGPICVDASDLQNETYTMFGGILIIYAYPAYVKIGIDIHIFNKMSYQGYLFPLFKPGRRTFIVQKGYEYMLHSYPAGKVDLKLVEDTIHIKTMEYCDLRMFMDIKDRDLQLCNSNVTRGQAKLEIQTFCGWYDPMIKVNIRFVMKRSFNAKLKAFHGTYELIRGLYIKSFICMYTRTKIMIQSAYPMYRSLVVVNASYQTGSTIYINWNIFRTKVGLTWLDRCRSHLLRHEDCQSGRLSYIMVKFTPLKDIPFMRDRFDILDKWKMAYILSATQKICTKRKCYQMVITDSWQSWVDAQGKCQHFFKSNLLSINSYEEYNLILEIVSVQRPKALDMIFIGSRQIMVGETDFHTV